MKRYRKNPVSYAHAYGRVLSLMDKVKYEEKAFHLALLRQYGAKAAWMDHGSKDYNPATMKAWRRVDKFRRLVIKAMQHAWRHHD